MNEKSVSVIIACYNIEENDIRRCIYSIEEQTIGRDNIEVILVDDCSTNNTIDILERISKEYGNIVIVKCDINQGPGGARNNGISVSNGKYISFLDHDDYYSSTDSLDTLLSNGNNADIICGTFNVETRGQKIKREGFTSNAVKTIKEWNKILKMPASLASKLYRRDFLIDNKIIFPLMRMGEDAVFAANCFISAKNIVSVDCSIYNYVQRDGSSLTTLKSPQIIIDEFKCKVLFDDILLRNGITPNEKTYNLDFIIREDLFKSKLNRDEYKEVYDSLTKISNMGYYNGFFREFLQMNEDNSYAYYLLHNGSVGIVRNFLNDSVLKLTELPIDSLYVNGKGGVYGELLLRVLFQYQKIQTMVKYVILIDEDCLLFNKDVLIDLITNMENNDIDVMGMPDGGNYIRHHRTDVPNLFFTVFKTDKIPCELENYDKWSIPLFLQKPSSSTFEPYYKMLTYLIGKCGLKFESIDSHHSATDDISTVLQFNGQDFCVHTWYARDFETDKENRDRIINTIKYYKEKFI